MLVIVSVKNITVFGIGKLNLYHRLASYGLLKIIEAMACVPDLCLGAGVLGIAVVEICGVILAP